MQREPIEKATCQILSILIQLPKTFNKHLGPLKNIQFCFISRQTKILTTGIHEVFRGLKFKSNAEIGQKGMFFEVPVFC